MISFQNVSMVYPNGTAALNNVTLNIKDGEFVFIIGKSGAGKTTLTKLLLCEERVTGGTLTVNNFKLNKLPQRKIPYLRRTLGVVFQDFRLFKNKTVYENIAFTLRVIGEDPRIIRKRVPYFLNVVDMTDKADRFPDELSGGEQQRVAFARALVNNPKIIIADEPTGNVDPEMSREIMDLLVRINKLGKTVIVVTHEKDLVDEYRHRVITIKDGEIVSDRSEGGYDEKD
ncbi:MAG: cell division ATP-binding protein FtsE [Ruminococcus sp.]|jgi:cell division ATP-binding protein ftsE|nr:cell division ATP-binding protein FtsE [Ruminococcus sp.]MDD6300809.1 cell division ATP-binding protein FtsE [Ruminococcus sp.]MDD7670635.1 cell division ATP-binding protein FtsE [Ruminococcus sp.]MDY2742569.1 cell division ATP-binding protein FtsE [Eubacteriales bacterium]CDD03353.1 cell division ATP-binding protein FtsE [Ruminococcus sp. CAG:382]